SKYHTLLEVVITYGARQFLDCRNSKTYAESNCVYIRIRSRVLWSKHGHTSRATRTSHIAHEQGDGGNRCFVWSNSARTWTGDYLCASQQLKPQEMNYLTHNLELVATVFILNIWRHCLYMEKCGIIISCPNPG
ncbi:hypothetical protein DVH24_002148, partial [Malus domestica]